MRNYQTAVRKVDWHPDHADIFVAVTFGRREGTVLIRVDLEGELAVDYAVTITSDTGQHTRGLIEGNLINGSEMSEGFQLFVLDTIKKRVIDRAEIMRTQPKPQPGRFKVGS